MRAGEAQRHGDDARLDGRQSVRDQIAAIDLVDIDRGDGAAERAIGANGVVDCDQAGVECRFPRMRIDLINQPLDLGALHELVGIPSSILELIAAYKLSGISIRSFRPSGSVNDVKE